MAAALALSGMTATADDDSPPKPPHKKEASDAEKKRDAKHKRARFKSLDTDGNGELSYQEFIQSDRLKAMPEEKT
ncbi:MAG: EF-hand domain-containing protein, partial [Akkermansiaceae bacterium]